MAEVKKEAFTVAPEELPSNSLGAPSEDSSENEESSITPVVQATFVEEKDTFIKKLRRALFDGDDSQSISDYIIFDVAVPTLKDMIAEMVSSGVEMMLFGEVRGRTKREAPVDKPSYGAYYKPARKLTSSAVYQQPAATPWGAGHGANDRMIFSTRRDAEDVLDRMYGLIEEYGVVTVADYLALCGVRSNYTDSAYGWTEPDLRRMNIRRIADGYTIDMPYAIELSRR